MKRNNKVALIILAPAIALLGITAALKQVGIGYNNTESAPIGIWSKQKLEKIERGKLIAFCPPNTAVIKYLVAIRPSMKGSCEETGSIEFIKAVGAVEGDTVTLQENENALINGVEVPNTTADTKIAFPPGEYKVNSGEVWTFSTYNEDSYDSRYFGPVPISNICGMAVPLFVDGDTKNMTKGINND